LRQPGSSPLKASLYACSFSGDAMMAAEDDGRRGTRFSKGGIVILLLVEFFVQGLTSMFVSCSDYICNK
jgi:hypothetical protein